MAVGDGDAVVAPANELQRQFDLVVATQDYHPPDHSSFASQHAGHAVGDVIPVGGVEQVLWPDHCVASTPGASFHSALDTVGWAAVFRKGTDVAIDSYSGFFDNARGRDTGLGGFLRERNVRDVFLCGLATDYCVKFTALDAAEAGFRAHVVVPACRGVDLRPGDSKRALQEMDRGGVVLLDSTNLGD